MDTITNHQLTDRERDILRILRAETSAEKPMAHSLLAKKVKTITVAAQIHSLRLKSFPICSKGRGYFYAHHDSEVGDFVKKLEREIIYDSAELEGMKASYFNINSFERSFGIDGKAEYYVTKAVRRGDKVAYEKFKVGPDGNPIIPAGTSLV